MKQAIAQGCSAVGLVSEMPSGPGVLPLAAIASIAELVPPCVASFLLTSKVTAQEIIAQQQVSRANTLQLVDYVSPGELRILKARLPGIAIVQVIHVVDETAIEEALAVSGLVDGLLLDSGNPSAPVKELGGTGRVHNWEISRKLRDKVWPTPVFLAGGLNAANVAEAIKTVQPYGVDICSGVRTNGKLDESKLAAFVAAVRRAVQTPLASL